MNATTTVRATTSVRYRGLAVTVLGDTRAGLLVIAGYGTPQEMAIAAIAVKRRRGQRMFCVAGSRVWMASVDDVAQAAVGAREARDASL